MYNEMNVLELSEQEIIRRNSMNELRAMGIEPYPAAEYVTNAFSTDIKAEFKDDAEPRKVSVAGRMMTRRLLNCRTLKVAFRYILPATISVREKTRISTTLYLNACST